MKDEIAEEKEELSEEQINIFAQNAKEVTVEQEKRREEIKKSEESMNQDFSNADQKEKVDLDEKYKNLLKKINKPALG